MIDCYTYRREPLDMMAKLPSPACTSGGLLQKTGHPFHTTRRIIAMNRYKILIATLLSFTFTSHASQAQSFRTWVAANGTDTGTCSTTAPCASISYAMGQTNGGGEVTCLTSGGFVVGQIVKSITINCAGVLASVGAANNGATITVSTSPTDRVVLRGLDIHSLSSTQALNFNGSGTLVLDQIKVTGGFADGASALVFAPTGTGKLVVKDSLFTNTGINSGAGILVKPQSGGTAQVMLERVAATDNAFGIAFDGTTSTGGINGTVADSVTSSNQNDGIVVVSSSGQAPIGITVINSRSVNNGYGIRSIGNNVTVRLQGSTVVGNGTGLTGGGALVSGGGNTLQANATNGGFTGSYALQ